MKRDVKSSKNVREVRTYGKCKPKNKQMKKWIERKKGNDLSK